MKISLSNVEFLSKQSKTLFNKKKSVTISLPNKDKLDKRAIKRAFMPNFIHSMDAANIHILIDKLIKNNINIPIFTIHDCFATTPNNMELLNLYVKEAFINLYFDEDYLKKMHDNIKDQIKSFPNIKVLTSLDINKNDLQKEEIVFKSGKVEKFMPNLPESFNWLHNKDLFIHGIKESNYFIT